MHSCHHRFTASLLQKSNILYSVNIYWKGCLVNTSRSWSLATSIIAWSATIWWRWCYFSCNSFTAWPSSTSRIPHFKDLQYVWNKKCEKMTWRSNDALKSEVCIVLQNEFWINGKRSTDMHISFFDHQSHISWWWDRCPNLSIFASAARGIYGSATA